MDIVPLTIWKEAEGEGEAGMTGVAWVISNRVAAKQWPDDPEEVCLQPYQFSCWNTDDPRRKVYPKEGDPQYDIAQDIWHNLGSGDDPTHGATFYRNEKVAGPFSSDYQITARIGNHTFAVSKSVTAALE
jgi:spore germination cell wall hydrolase CwlJ-like protein